MYVCAERVPLRLARTAKSGFAVSLGISCLLALAACSHALPPVEQSAYSARVPFPPPRLVPPGAREQDLVTARKREEPILLAPVSVTSLAAGDLARRGQRRLNDLQAQIPNLLIDSALGSANSARVTLRGLGQNEPTSSSDPAVGIYVDGVYRPRLNGSLLTLYDVERIEVTRGPQGALFGKNTIGGAINVVTRRPDFRSGGAAELRFGNFGALETRAALDVPLIPEKLALRASAASATRDGYVVNRLNGDRYADEKFLGGRLQLLALPDDDLEVRVALEATREDRKPLAGKCVLTGPGFGLAGILARDSGQQAACRRDQRSSEFKTAQDVSFTDDALATTGISAQVSYDLSASLSLVSISSARRQQGELSSDLDGTPVPFLQSQSKSGRNEQSALTQELQLSGRAADNRLRYVLGVFALREDNRERRFDGLGFSADAERGRVVRSSARTRRAIDTHNTSYALYGQGVYSLTERLDLSVGARLTEERKRVRSASSVLGERSGGFAGFDRSRGFRDVSPMATLSYALAPRVQVYGTYATGFQGGGFDGLATQASDTGSLAEQELTSYEIGIKSSGFGGRLGFSAAAFYNLLDDQRVQFTALAEDGRSLAVSQRSAARTLLRGGEAELSVLAAPGLQLSANLGALRGEVEDLGAEVPVALRGENRPPGAPNYTLNFGVDYQKPVGALGTLGVRSSWTQRGALNVDAQGTDALEAPKVGLLDGRVSLALADGRTEVAVYGTNLLDRRYFFNGASSEASFGFVQRFFGPPRFCGVEVRRSF